MAPAITPFPVHALPLDTTNLQSPRGTEVPLWEEQILQPYRFYRLSVCSPRCILGALDQAQPKRSCYLKPLQKHWKSSGWALIRGLGAAEEVNCAGEL